jgi:hypothetical protein
MCSMLLINGLFCEGWGWGGLRSAYNLSFGHIET